MRLFPPEGTMSFLIKAEFILVSAVNPGHSDILQQNHDEERQSGRIIVKHGHKVVPGSLDKCQTNKKGKYTAANCKERAESSVCYTTLSY